nr:MAG TPA: hypothetical protein [Caudoviricetes sp.]
MQCPTFFKLYDSVVCNFKGEIRKGLPFLRIITRYK